MQTNGDGSEQLARHYEHRVRFFTRKVAQMFLLGSRWEDELASAGYWGLAKALDNRRPDASSYELSAYVSQRIFGEVINEARSCLNRAQKESPSPVAEPLGDLESWEDQEPSPEQIVAVRSVWEQIEDALSSLDSRQRLMLRGYMEGASIVDLANREGIPVGTMQTRFDKATRLLRGRAPHIRRVLREAG
jgi:RNA polymerase sigma factor (sigma-70 family)